MKPTVPFEVMLSAKAIKARPRNYRADDMKIALCDEHGELRVLSAADALADWVIANCEGLPDTTPKPGLIGLEIERIEVDE